MRVQKTLEDFNPKSRVCELFWELNEKYFDGSLGEYKIEFSRTSVRTHGTINFGKKTIRLSRNLLDQFGWSALKNTLLHEMTHAYVVESGGRVGHTKRFWSEFEKRGGVRDSVDVKPKGVHVYSCPSCGMKTRRIRRIVKSKISCGVCDKRYNPAHQLVYERTEILGHPGNQE